MNKPIEIEDLTAYRLPMHLCENPSASAAAFEVHRSDCEKNMMHQDIWILENGMMRQLTATYDASILAWDDDRHLLISRKISAEKRMYIVFLWMAAKRYCGKYCHLSVSAWKRQRQAAM